MEGRDRGRGRRRPGIGDAFVGVCTGTVALDVAQVLHVRPGAEPAPRAGHDDDPDVRVGGGLREGGVELLAHVRRPGIQPLGTVQGDGRDALANAIEDLLVRHGDATSGRVS